MKRLPDQQYCSSYIKRSEIHLAISEAFKERHESFLAHAADMYF